MNELADVSVNSTYLILGSIASAAIIGKPVFTWTLGWIRTPGRNKKWDERVDGAIWGRPKTRYEPNPPAGIVEQQEKTANAVTLLVETVERLAERFEQHVDHPPGADK